MINSDIYNIRLSKLGGALTILPVKEMGSQYALDFATCPLPESVCKQKISEQFSSAYLAGGYEAKGVTKSKYMDLGIAHILKSPFFGDANKVLLEGDRVILVYKTNSIFTLEQLLRELHATEIKKAVEAGKPVDWDAIDEDHPGAFNKNESPEDPMQGFNSNFEDMLYGQEESSRNNLFSSDTRIINRLQASRESGADDNLSPLDFFSTGSVPALQSRSTIEDNERAEARFSMMERRARGSFSELLNNEETPKAEASVMDVGSLARKQEGEDYLKDIFVFNENLSSQAPQVAPSNGTPTTVESAYFDSMEEGDNPVERDLHTQPFDFGSESVQTTQTPKSDNLEGSDEERVYGEDGILAGTGPMILSSEGGLRSGPGFNFAAQDNHPQVPSINTPRPTERSDHGVLDEAGESASAGEMFSFEPSEGSLSNSPAGFEFGQEPVNETTAFEFPQEPNQAISPSSANNFDFESPVATFNSDVANESEQALASSPVLTQNESLENPNEKSEECTRFNFDMGDTKENSGESLGSGLIEENGWVDNESFGGADQPAPWESTLNTFAKKKDQSERRGN